MVKNLTGEKRKNVKLLGQVDKNNQFWPKSQIHFTD